MAGLTPVTGALATYLEANRDELNRRVAEADRTSAAFDIAAFADVLATLVAPVLDAVDAHGDGFTALVAETMLDITFELCAGDRLVGAVRAGWLSLLPLVPGPIAADPRRVIGALTNALANLERTPGARPDQWLALMTHVAATAPTPDVLLAAGQVAAWRAGMAIYRDAALEVAATFDEALLGIVLAVTPEGLARLRVDPRLDPATGTRRVEPLRVGTFRGLGGPFVHPPLVALDAERPDQVVAFDGEGVWFVFADACGSGLVRATDSTPVLAAGGDAPAALSSVAEVTSWVEVHGGLAVTSALSHSVIFLRDGGTVR